MAKEFLGRGWAFPLRPDASGALAWAALEEDVAQAVEIVLMTRVGERAMRPGFGSAVAKHLFDPGSLQYLGLVETAVKDALRDWEPRIQLLGVSATPDAADETRVLVDIDYVVRRTNSRANLVFPFYLGGMEGP